MTSSDWEAWREPLREIAEAAGARILEVYEGADAGFEVEAKADETPLTRADRAAHEHIRAALQRLAPDLPQLSEEGEEIDAASRRQWRRYWLIDPLDGTREFIKRNGEFTVNIALVDGGRPVLGVVHAPDGGVSWSAVAGGSAYRHEAGGQRALQSRSAQPPWTVVVSRSHREAAVEQLLERVGDYRELSVGSSLKICRVAEGEADLYPRFGPTCEWDTAAAQCVLEAAGGALMDIGLTPLRYNTADSLLNPDFIAVGDPRQDWGTLTRGLEWEARR
ncbi:3'(2'),5'-bisphosphate nucleotidase CysQ [Halorhodospira neutriphila]|uniref:3'(2'),5'-bisphosphate nucleotidase CysQ n=1 Tax=Halorhodospira neutriphila TaxID=168379 RepID=A0ABS1E5R5_9GAMM|nr:3'(2'),5'-bisphosphate nucleotidase CysQ [Halorhodospira neutriphila]MBK1726863.1 3'(2'),5'-bisphosphate nucleotidase [Halorhodospira neutriphila]